MAVGENEIQTIFTANLSGLQTGLATAQKGVQGFANTAKGALASLAPLAAIAGITVGIQQSVKAFGEFEDGLNQVRKQLGSTRQGELHDFEQGLRGLATTTGEALPALTSGLAQIVSLGLDAGNEMKALTSATELGQAAGESTSEAIKALDIVVKQFGASAGSTSEIADKLFGITLAGGEITLGQVKSTLSRVGPAAKVAGADFNDLAGQLAYMGDKGINTRLQFNFLQETLSSVGRITTEQAAVFKSQGIELDSTTIKTKSYQFAVGELAKLSETQAAAIGINAGAFRLLKAQMGDATLVQQKYNEIANTTGRVTEEAKKKQETFNGQIKILGEVFRQVSIDALLPLIPIIKDVISNVGVVVGQFNEWLNANRQNIDVLLALIGEGLEPLLKIIGPIAGFIFDVVSNTLDWISTNQDFVRMLGGVVMKSLEDFLKLLRYISPTLTWIFDSIAQAIKGFAAWNKELREQNDAMEEGVKYTRGVAEELGVFETAQSRAAKATREAADATEEESIAAEEAAEKKKGEKAAIDAKILAQKEEERQLDVIVLKYQKLLKAYEDGEITQEKFREGLAGIVEEGTKVTGSIEGITKKLEDFNKTDTTISVKVRLEADQEIKSIKERILQAQEDITLAQLDGEQRKRKEIDITLQRALRALQVELDGEIIRHNGVIALLEKERAFRADEITNRKGLLDEARRKELADLEAEIKYRLDVEKSKNLTLTDSIKQLEAIQRQTADLAVQNLDREAAGKDKVIDKTYQQIAAEEEKNRVISSAPGSTVDFGGFSPGARTTFTGGIGGLTLTTLSPFTSSIKEQVVATKNLAQSAAELKAFQAAMAPRISGFTSGVQVGPTGVLSSKYFGTPYVPKTGLYELHRGEAVIPAEQNSKQEGAGITVVNLIDPAMVPQILAQYPNAVLNIVNNDILRNGQTRRVIRATR